MDKQNKQIVPPKDDRDDDEDDIYSSIDTVVSSMECTGLIQTPPSTEPEAEAYTDLYTIPKPTNDKPNGLQAEKKTHGSPSVNHA